ncbi:FAD-dependent oxidoreductase [uncultured Dubosiella sp.]|jgi:thioredoxin reductase (NADPH)|uniref:NAD(P)/FAD-dependent oxidoreductase n=1 Tax=uncultured Dubosiella sp. TaxID=1937011 RepID=UPI0020801655|nr:FAD-dependent oxidoreductase [uncultured Dubosiella sp.]GJM56368.1 thioredoxin reductase [Erysipelotrichaceae bacterium OPF54]
MSEKYDLIIIGAGPAGMTAALYASRSGLKTCIVESGAPGGKLLKTFHIENYPGIKEMGGAELAMVMFDQALAFGAEYKAGEVVKVNKDKSVELLDGTILESNCVLLATGTKERMLNIPGEQENVGKGVSFCAVCDGAFFRGKDVVVIGGGNSALEEAGFLTQFVNKLYIVIRRDQFRAEEKFQREVEENEKIEIIREHVPLEVLSDGKVTGIVLKNVKTGKTQTVDCSGIFPYVGSDPISDCVKDLGVCNEHGYVIVDRNMETAVKGVYAAGDVVDKQLRQVVTAVGEGALVAQQAYKEVKEK